MAIGRGRRLSGRVVVTDGYEPCVASVDVTIRRNGNVIRKVTTNELGLFTTKVPSYRGRYTAALSPSSPDAGHICSGARATRLR